MSQGIVYLVGAGPGDPGLLTLRGAEVLAAADLVLYDGLVNPLLLRRTRGRSERTSRAQHDAGATVPQVDVNRRLIAAARAGECVVRLKGGDPFLFGRGSEEARALAEAGIPFEVIPGVTAAIAAGEYAGISFTHRELASAVAFVTGHEDPTKPGAPVDYAALARFPGTLVFYMGLKRIASIAAALTAEGLSPQTPAAVICRASLPSQRTVVAPLSELAAAVERADLHPPSLIVIGECVSQRERIAWFEHRPLFGKRIGITRPHELADASDVGLSATISQCLKLGAEPVLMPLIAVRPTADTAPLDAALAKLSGVDWLVFTSANGVHAFMQRLWESGGDARRLASIRIACIGPATAAALEAWRLRADLVPESYRAEALAEALLPHVHGQRVLWPRASRGRDVLPTQLRAAGADVTEVVVYDNRDEAPLPPGIGAQITAGTLDWIGLSSPSIARSLAALLPPEARSQIGVRTRLAAISPVTADAARDAGLPVAAVADTYTWDGLFAAIVAAEASVR
jgi:uroporphyrinogen III methyltransferase/synthase